MFDFAGGEFADDECLTFASRELRLVRRDVSKKSISRSFIGRLYPHFLLSSLYEKVQSTINFFLKKYSRAKLSK